MKNFKRSIAALAVVSALGMSAGAFAANNAGILTGSITDSNKTVIAGASVTIKNISTGFTRTVIANDDGSYRFPSLPIGTYTVTTNKDGYASEVIENVRVSIGEVSVTATMFQDGVERIAITGSAISSIDTSSAETALNIGAVELARIPVPRDVTSVALLAPGTTRGDSRLGGASFGGSSVAENSMYINGLNVTNFRNGLGFSNVPYDFYETFQVKTGGYSAEFGRSTGGVVNAVTKSGSNEFAMGGSIYLQPEALRETSPSVRANDGSWYTYRDDDTRSSTSANIWASGALIQDELFYYVIYNPRNITADYDRTKSDGDLNKDSQDSAFWGAKIDWNITDNHRVELLAFSDADDTESDVYRDDKYQSTVTEKNGGQNWSLKYTGYITDDITFSALYGENTYDITTSSTLGDECALVLDNRFYDGANTSVPVEGYNIGCAGFDDYSIEEGDDKRQAFRADIEWVIGDDHLLRFGFDQETNSSYSNQKYSGPDGAYWILYPGFQGTSVNDVVLSEDTDYTRNRIRTVSGDFETIGRAFYIEDTWNITDNLTAIIGVRNEQFDNKNGEGETFAKIDNMIAPRLGLSWDINGDGDSKAFINLGRYFLPVANNTNVRLSGNESDSREYFYLDGLQENDFNGTTYYTPILGEQLGEVDVISSGATPDTRSIVDAELDPMFQDELIIGYQTMINDEWSTGIKYTHRSMNGAIDDMIIDHAYVNAGICDSDYHPSQYVLGNPGEDMRVFGDSDCDGTPDEWMTFSAEDLEYDKAERTYSAIDVNVAKQWDEVWSLSATYTWSRSFGNAEGLVKSDNGQADAGLTTDWDFPELMDGANGYLPNDRRHMFKVYGTVAITEDLSAGFNFNMESGRPQSINGLGHPDVGGEVSYGSTYWLANDTGEIDGNGDAIYDWTYTPRGAMGRLPWQTRLDLNLRYTTEIAGLDTTFKVDVFNVLNADSYTRVNETGESSFAVTNSRTYGRPLAFQTPRYVQFSASFTF